MSIPTLILASSSPYRRQLLERLCLPFTCVSPDVDESAHDGEVPADLVQRLAMSKARAVAMRVPEALIIGSDQVAVGAGTILSKPGDYAGAHAQLRLLSGREVDFLTGLCLLNSRTGRAQVEMVKYSVRMRELSEPQIAHYLELEAPFDCAGSFKSEALGIALFEEMAGEDPTALIGLPLIRLTQMLFNEGVDVLRVAR